MRLGEQNAFFMKMQIISFVLMVKCDLDSELHPIKMGRLKLLTHIRMTSSIHSTRAACCRITAHTQRQTPFVLFPACMGVPSTNQQLFYTNFSRLTSIPHPLPVFFGLRGRFSRLVLVTLVESFVFVLLWSASEPHPSQLQLVSYLVQPSGGAR